MKRTVQISLCGILAGLEIVLMLIAGWIPGISYAFPAIAGVLSMVIVVECNVGWAFGCYAVTAALSLLLVAKKETALLYVVFFGCYPIVKALLEKIKWKIPAFLCKLAFFNAAAIGLYFLAVWLQFLPENLFVLFGVSVPWLFLLGANAVFVLYDFWLTAMIRVYYRRLHGTVSRWMHR